MLKRLFADFERLSMKKSVGHRLKPFITILIIENRVRWFFDSGKNIPSKE